jgi:hypothetical protein
MCGKQKSSTCYAILTTPPCCLHLQLQRLKRAARLHRLFLLRRALASWQQAMQQAAARRGRQLRASCHREARTLNAAWSAWLRHLAFQHDSRRVEGAAQHHLAARLLTAWRNVVLCARLNHNKVGAAAAVAAAAAAGGGGGCCRWFCYWWT